MKLGYLFSVAIVPCIIFTSIIGNQPKGNNGKEKGENKSYSHKENHNEGNGQSKHRDEQKGKNGNDKREDKGWKNEHKEYAKGESKGKGKNDNWGNDDFDKRIGKMKNYKNGKWNKDLNYDAVSWWNGSEIYQAKTPRNSKKVSICHKPNGSDYPVNINVSVNALKAHLNHGDYEGECRDFDRSRYSDVYWNTRKDYYDQYVSTTETLSFGEQLLQAAIDKLTNGRTQLAQDRNRLAAADLERRERALLNLQNDTYRLQQSLDTSNERVVKVSLISF